MQSYCLLKQVVPIEPLSFNGLKRLRAKMARRILMSVIARRDLAFCYKTTRTLAIRNGNGQSFGVLSFMEADILTLPSEMQTEVYMMFIILLA
jgi:hypothetical protein